MKPALPCGPIRFGRAGLLMALVLSLAPLPAPAQTVWRCGGADGRGVSYSDRPCADGRALALADERSAEQVQAAREVAARERRLADQLTAERQQRDALPPPAPRHDRRAHPAAPAALSPAAPRRPGPKRRAAPPPEDARTWRAVVPATPRKKG
ncbi:MAG: DUF4124 domain-containing protein [Burkholderiales bacterium]|nr:DUF4124 domain-containing protein [Burkholderiales bacterium]